MTGGYERDPADVARHVNAAWAARVHLARFRARPQETPTAALDRRCELLEAAVYDLARRLAEIEARLGGAPEWPA